MKINTDVQPFCRPQIANLIVKGTSTKIPIKYANFADVFSHTGINKHAIKLVDTKRFIRLSKSAVDTLIFLERQSQLPWQVLHS